MTTKCSNSANAAGDQGQPAICSRPVQCACASQSAGWV